MLETLHLNTWLRLLRPGSSWVAPYVPTPMAVASRLLSLARLKRGETVVDLGCGDGRLLTLAAQEFGAARGIGYEMDAQLAEKARALTEEVGNVHIFNEDLANAAPALEQADVVTLYLSVSGNALVYPLLTRHLKSTARVVSYVWDMPVAPTRTVLMPGSGAPLHLFEHADLVTRHPGPGRGGIATLRG